MSATSLRPAAVHDPVALTSVALAGNPNAGKTTLFNALTGLRQKVANYPGITVEKKTGRARLADGGALEIIDLPGTYSLIPTSPDEQVAVDVLRGLRPDTPPPAVVVAVVDASNLPRNLYLVGQLIELGRPLVVALTMTDIAERRGQRVDAEALARDLGVAVVPVVGNRGRGIDRLLQAVAGAAAAVPPAWPLPEAMWEELHQLGGLLALRQAGQADAQGAQEPEPDSVPAASARVRRHLLLANRLLIGDRARDLGELLADPRIGVQLASATRRLEALAIDPVQADIEARYRWIDGVAARCASAPPAGGGRTATQRLDAVFMHRFWGLVVFALVMTSVFIALFWLAAPLMDGIGALVDWLAAATTVGLGDGPLKDLLVDGVFAGVGGVVVFVPQIALLFLFLATLEDSGYLARAAFLMDRALAKVGLHGKSFIPLLSSFACAIPGIMATRTIDSPRERMATILVAPFMSCSARLPVYLLLIGAFFAGYGAWAQGLVMLGCYLLGILAAAGTAWAFKLAGTRHAAPAPFILEMPSYKRPQLGQIARQVWTSTGQFLVKAGTTIFCLSILLWALAYYPRLPDERAAAFTDPVAAGQAQLEHSVAGRIGHGLEPIIAPLGFDWKIGVGLVGAFAAREVFNSTLGIIYSVGGDEDNTVPLSEAIAADRRPDGRPVWTPLVAVSLLAWFVLAMQCMSTVAVVKRETGGWRWPLFQLAYMNALAYVVCLGIYQVGTRVLGY